MDEKESGIPLIDKTYGSDKKDVEIDIDLGRDKSISSSKQTPGKEEVWHSSTEELIMRWRESANKAREMHDESGYHYKKRKVQYGLLPILIPLVMAPMSVLLDDWHYGTIFSSFMFASVGLFSGLNSFFAPGEQMRNHFEFAGKYADMVTEIDAEMHRYREYRAASDVFVMKIKMMVDRLTDTAPVIPKNIATGKSSIWGDFVAFCCCA